MCEESSHQIKAPLWALAMLVYPKHLDLSFSEGKKISFGAYFTFLMRKGEGVMWVVHKRGGSPFMHYLKI